MDYEDGPAASEDYWSRLNSNAFDHYDDLDAKADEWEREYFGAECRTRAGPKKGKKNFVIDIQIGDEPLYPPSPRPVQQAFAAHPAPVSTSPQRSAVRKTPPPFDAMKCYTIARRHNALFDNTKVVIRKMSATDVQTLLSGYEHMLHSLATPRFQARYHHDGVGDGVSDLRFGEPVPSYFANVSSSSMYRRKALSIGGLRNLVEYGPIIFAQLEKKLFDGNPAAYGATEGLQLMRTMTGNVVDLDTTVLRCNDAATLQAINASNRFKGLPTHASAASFGSSDQASEIAINCALPVLEEFARRFNLSDTAAHQRNVHPSQLRTPIAIACDNSTRGHTAIWHYVNAGQDSFHANVPTIDDVVGALLRAPFLCIENYALLHCQHSQLHELDHRMDDFFENCVADSCFNMKWKAIEEFSQQLSREGSIVQVLDKLQADNQVIFTGAFFDADDDNHTNEISEMTRLAKGRRGKDKTGEFRDISPADVEIWVRSLAAGKQPSI